MGRQCLEPPSPALDGLLRSTPPQFAAPGAIVAVIAVAILSLRSCSLIRARRRVRVCVCRRRLRGYPAPCHRSRWRTRSGGRRGRAADSRRRRRPALDSCGCRAQATPLLSWSFVSKHQVIVVVISLSGFRKWFPGRCLVENARSWTLPRSHRLCGGFLS